MQDYPSEEISEEILYQEWENFDEGEIAEEAIRLLFIVNGYTINTDNLQKCKECIWKIIQISKYRVANNFPKSINGRVEISPKEIINIDILMPKLLLIGYHLATKMGTYNGGPYYHRLNVGTLIRYISIMINTNKISLIQLLDSNDLKKLELYRYNLLKILKYTKLNSIVTNFILQININLNIYKYLKSTYCIFDDSWVKWNKNLCVLEKKIWGDN